MFVKQSCLGLSCCFHPLSPVNASCIEGVEGSGSPDLSNPGAQSARPAEPGGAGRPAV